MSRRYAARTHKMAHRFASRVRATHARTHAHGTQVRLASPRHSRRVATCGVDPPRVPPPTSRLCTPRAVSVSSPRGTIPAQERLIPVALGGDGIFEVKPGVSKALVEWEVLGHRAMHEQAHKDQTEASLCLDIVRRHRRRPWPQAPAPPPPLPPSQPGYLSCHLLPVSHPIPISPPHRISPHLRISPLPSPLTGAQAAVLRGQVHRAPRRHRLPRRPLDHLRRRRNVRPVRRCAPPSPTLLLPYSQQPTHVLLSMHSQG